MIRSRPRWCRSISSGAATRRSYCGGSGAVARCGEDLLGLAAAVPAASLGPLRRLKILVALEEVLDLVAQLVRDVVDVTDALEGWIAVGDAEELLVRAFLVLHVEDPDRADADPAAREGRVG